jgi:hypothetical protein
MPPAFTTYEVWKVNENGEMIRLVKEYGDRGWAENRADSEAEDEWRDGVTYAVKKSTTETPGSDREDIPASEFGLDGIELKNPIYTT